MNQESWALKSAMRRLWSDHVIWTREYVVAAIKETPDKDAAAGRLLRNQEDIGNAVVPLYGDDAGKGLAELLKQHILIAVDLIEAAKAGDEERFQSEDEKWSRNVEEIAGFLNGANPNWPKNDVLDLLNLHLTLTKGEVVARLQEDWLKDVESFDEIFTEILTVADALSDGIIKQFPERYAA
jgi:hypothetical protein